MFINLFNKHLWKAYYDLGIPDANMQNRALQMAHGHLKSFGRPRETVQVKTFIPYEKPTC